MTSSIKPGTVMMRADINFPMVAALKGQPYLPGWKLIDNCDAHSVDQIVRKAGWTFFFLAPNIRASAWGAHDSLTLRKAMTSILQKVKKSKFNCLEISEVEEKSFLGFPYIRLCAHSRHIKQSTTLNGR